MTKKYNDAEVIAMAKVASRHAETFKDLADALDMPTSSLRDVFERTGYDSKDALLLEIGADALEDIDALKRQVKYLKRVNSRLEGRLADRRWLKEEVAGLVSVLEPVIYPKPSIVKNGSPQKQVCVLEISDIHFGLHVPLGQLGPIFGAYDESLARRRMEYTFANAARLAHQQSFEVDEIVVYLLGDLIEHSNMRVSQAKQISSHVVKQSITTGNLLIGNIRMLCEMFPRVRVKAVPGNHSRATKKAGDNMPDETFEHFMYWGIQHALSAQENLQFDTHAAWYFVDEIFGRHFLGLHGEDAFSWAGIPWYGIKRLVQDYYMIMGQAGKAKLRKMPLTDTLTVEEFLNVLSLPDYVCIGHFHDPLAWSVMGVEVLANGSMSGISLYSAKKLHNVTPPSQNMFFVHPEHGVGLRLPIDLSGIT